MAIDAYLQIDGIKGESQDDRHTDWIECLSVNWGAHQPRSAGSLTSGGHTAERAELSEISLCKLADLSTPILLQTCSMGRTISKARIELFRADATGTRVLYFSIDMENVLIGHVSPDVHQGNLLAEHIGLKYSNIKWRYTRQKIGGGAGGSTVGGWDLTTNRITS